MRKLVLLLLGVIAVLGSAYAQNRTITGKVLDEKGTPIPNVTVLAKGSQIGGTTDVEGSFSLSVPSNTTQLLFSIIGYEPQSVNLTQATTNYSVVLKSASAALEDVIITGYTRERRSSFTGAAAKVEAKAINQIPNASIDQILQGRAAGLYVTAGSGQPGSAANVIIRGVGSINGSTTPLYIMDGIPIEAGAFASLSASDIESVDILKDASATALYGSRGSNGVIIITTKRGRARDRVQFGVKSQIGWSDRTRPKFIMMNSEQRLRYEEEIGLETGSSIGPGWDLSRKNPGNTGLPEAELQRYDGILDSLRNMNISWPDIFFRQGKFQEHDISASGGSERVSFYSSLNYFKQDGIAIRSSLERYSLRNNLDFRGNRLSGTFSSTINYSSSSFIESENTTAVSNPFAAAYYALPYENPYVNGVLVHPGLAGQYGVLDLREGTLALERLLSTTSKRNELKAVASANFRYKIVEGLSAVSTIGLDFRERLTERLVDPNTYSGSGSRVTFGQGSFGESVNRFLRLTGNIGLNYAKTFDSRHRVDVSALYESIKTTGRNFNYTGYGIYPLLLGPAGITPGSVPTPGSGQQSFIPVVGGGRSHDALQSAIAIARYVLDDKYTFNATYRNDGSSSVPKDNRWISYYSVGAAWNVFKEDFMTNVNWLSDLQLRASYGLTASPFGDFSFGYLTLFTPTRYNGVLGTGLSQLGNEKYDWEYTRTLDVGLDFSLLNKRIRGTFDFYNRSTENLFISQQLSATSGVGSQAINAGSMRNRGVELTLSGDVVSTKDFTWTVGGNGSYNANEITDLGQATEYELGTSIVRVGLPFGTHYIPRWAGVNASTGDPLYYNRDKSVTTQYDAATQSVAEFGSYLPKFQGGFNSSMNYKGIYVEAFFSFAQGNKRFNNEDFFNETPSFATSNQSIKMFDRWQKPGDITNVQKFGTQRIFSSKDIQDASFLRFRNLNIGYNLPASVISKLKGVSGITIYGQGQNLYTWTKWTGFDPEDNNNIATFEYPAARTYTVGLNVTF